MMNARILIAEDERDLADILRDTLTTLDYCVEVSRDGEAALSAYKAERPDLLITDVMMPRMDGYTLVETIRQTDASLPIIMLTARTDTDDVVKGLHLGANDYLRKPFSMRELVARIAGLLRQTAVKRREVSETSLPSATMEGGWSPQGTLRCGDTLLFPLRNIVVTPDQKECALTQREMEILRRLFEHPNEIVEREGLLIDLWGSNTPYNARSLHVFISRLRTKLAADAQLTLLNVHGVGYRLAVAPSSDKR